MSQVSSKAGPITGTGTGTGTGQNLTPIILNQADTPFGRVELVEWYWPDLLDFVQAETELMVEMSLPPHSTDASACFVDLAPEKYCYVGTLFIRMPGFLLHGRSDGGHIRVIRWVFDAATAEQLLEPDSAPPLEFLQSLLNLRSEGLRSLMRLSLRELPRELDRSDAALAALGQLVLTEVTRLFEHQPKSRPSGRLAAWQYRRIRERLANGADRPSVNELAKLCGISTRHLHRQFHALTGETISDYIETHLIKEAKHLLVESAAPIKQVAQAAGFAHPNSFSRAFRRATGLSPKQYRQQMQSSGLDLDRPDR